MSQWNVRRYEKEHLKTIFGGSGEAKTVLDDPMEVLVNGREACDAAVGQCVWQELGKNGEEKIKKSPLRAFAGMGSFMEDSDKGGRRRGLPCGSARSVDVESQASLALRCILASVTWELQTQIIWRLCPPLLFHSSLMAPCPPHQIQVPF